MNLAGVILEREKLPWNDWPNTWGTNSVAPWWIGLASKGILRSSWNGHQIQIRQTYLVLLSSPLCKSSSASNWYRKKDRLKILAIDHVEKPSEN
jgi:hypothetical protein